MELVEYVPPFFFIVIHHHRLLLPWNEFHKIFCSMSSVHFKFSLMYGVYILSISRDGFCKVYFSYIFDVFFFL